jgi:hypothetical protein
LAKFSSICPPELGAAMAGLVAVAERLLAAVDWEREAYPAYDDFLALPLFALFFPAARFLLDRLVFEVRHALILASVYSVESFGALFASGSTELQQCTCLPVCLSSICVRIQLIR